MMDISKILEAVGKVFAFFTTWFDPKAREGRKEETKESALEALKKERDRLLLEECKTDEAKEKNAIALGAVVRAINSLRTDKGDNNG